MSKILVVANWKMNPPTFREAKKLFDAVKKAAAVSRGSAVVVAPPAIFLRELAKGTRGKIAFALQNAHAEAGGARTGEISMRQGRDAHARYVLVGHAERRASGETNEDTRKKTAAALAARLIPVLCVGESERSGGGEQFEVVREQLRVGLADVPESKVGRIVVTYEPLWSIGKKTTMNPREMHQMAIFLRKCVVDSHGNGGHSLKILYGGSVDERNAGAMLREGDVAGFLVGRASVSATEFTKLLQAIESTQV